ncbi:MAG: TonB-dependent receptor [Bryobacteraceae bacterium]
MIFVLIALRLLSTSSPGQATHILKTTITVTAERGMVAESESAATVAHSMDRGAWGRLPMPTLGSALHGSAGVLVQQSTYGQVSPFLRGLTGYQVLNILDGIRFNNSTFRSGPNQYLAFLDAGQAERVEAVLGPFSAPYGSDAMGGAIQVLSPSLQLNSDPFQPHGEFSLTSASADKSLGGYGQLSFQRAKWAWLVGGSGRGLGDLRAGGGTDSRHTLRRLFGLNPDQIEHVTGSRQPGSGFLQSGFHSKFLARPSDKQSLTLWYQRSVQDGVQGYKDLWGGLGRMQSLFEPQILDFAYARYERQNVAWLDTLSGVFSVNQQRDGSIRQGLRSSDSITADDSNVRSYGYLGQGSARIGSRQALLFGGEFYDEHINSVRTVTANGRPAPQRPLYPDGSRYGMLGLFAQDTLTLIPSKLRALVAARFTRVGYKTFATGFGVAEGNQTFRDATYQASLSWQVTGMFAWHASAGRGFRAPNANDLGAIGLNDLGYEIPAAESVSAGALLGNNSGETATSLGRPITGLKAESLRNYETGFTLRHNRLYARLQGFHADIYDPIVRRTLLFPIGNTPGSLGGIAVTPIAPTAAQQAQGVQPVATSFDPRAVKAFVNDGQTRYYGTEILTRVLLHRHWHAEAAYSFIAGRDLFPNRNVRRLPPQSGMASLRYDGKWWLEIRATASGAQRRLSGGDIDDERIGASRRRQDIADFFNGSRIAPYLANGVFSITGETLRQIQDRVLPGVADGVRVPLYNTTAGWVAFDIHGGMPIGERWRIGGGIGNLLDKNYRLHGSGVDAPGWNAFANLRFVF